MEKGKRKEIREGGRKYKKYKRGREVSLTILLKDRKFMIFIARKEGSED